MSIKNLINKDNYLSSCNILENKELLIFFYFLIFILGLSNSIGYNFYHEFRIIEVLLLLILGFFTVISQHQATRKIELLFFVFIALGSFFWDNALFIIIDLLLAYLLYKSFCFLNYNELITKAIVLSSLVIFLMLPVALWDYINSGAYFANWYPLPWNIRVYNSYFLILSIFAVWFYLTGNKYKNIYLVFLFLAFLSILLDAGRSVILAYTVFITVICIFNRMVRWKLLSVYSMSWLTYLSITYLANLNTVNSSIVDLQIVRATTSLRYDLWVNAFQCWSQRPLLGCGFYQLDRYQMLAAHPHNLFIQILTETGLIGFGFLMVIIIAILKHIDWNSKKGYFVIAALLAIGIDMSLSGVHIYPITQISLLWLFVFLLKNPDFSHAQYFNRVPTVSSKSDKFLSVTIYMVLTIIFIYIFINTTIFSGDTLSAPPRFWGSGYQLF